MNQNIITIIVVAASALLNYLLTQPANTFSPQALLVIGGMSVVLTAVSRFLPSQGQPVQVEVTKQAAADPPADAAG